MFVVDLHTLGAVYQLDLIDQVALQLMNTANLQQRMGDNGAFGELLTFVDEVAFAHRQMLMQRNGVVFFGHTGHRVLDDQLPFAPGQFIDFNKTVDLGNFSYILGHTGFKQFGNTRQTAGNVLVFSRLTGHSGDDHTRRNFGSVFDHQHGTRRKRITGKQIVIGILDGDLRVQVVTVFHNCTLVTGTAAAFLFLDGNTFNQIGKFDNTAFFNNNRHMVRFPTDEDFVGFDQFAVTAVQN